MSIKVNPEMVKLARESRGFSQKGIVDDLESKGFSISQAKYSKIESGIVEIKADTEEGKFIILRLSEVLDYPVDFFIQEPNMAPLISSLVYHRKRKSMPAKLMSQLYGKIKILRLHLDTILDEGTLLSSVIPHIEIAGDITPEDIARDVRDKLNITINKPVDNLTFLIEEAGGIVIPFHFGAKQIDALSFRLESGNPVFVINKEIPGDRWRFTLAHELGHIVMHDMPYPKMEPEADMFASEFLMPREMMLTLLVALNLRLLVELKPVWKVSMAALLVRAYNLELINERNYRYYWMTMSKAGFRQQEPEPIPKEETTTLRNQLKAFMRNCNDSVEDTIRRLKVNMADFTFLYGDCLEGGLSVS